MPCSHSTHSTILESKGRVLSAHIVSTYPVRWSAFAVLRDFIQNFFDETGPAGFASGVSMDTKQDRVLIRMPSRGFDLIWLTHIGASTKTQAMPGTTAGYFGEGFKLAALCAVRDLHWRVSMGSLDWSAAVTLAPEYFGDTRVEVLAYHVHPRNLRAGSTWLELEGLSAQQCALLPMVRNSFCYPENPWLGEPLEQSTALSVYLRSDVPIPSYLPFVIGHHKSGLLFLGHQARGTLSIPFVIAMPKVRREERDRPALYDFQAIDALHDAARLMSPRTAARLLPFLSTKWRLPAPRRYAVGSWSRVVTALVRRIASDPDVKQAWKATLPLALVCEPVKRSDVQGNNRRRRALAWARHTVAGVPLVQAAFLELGYPRVEQACERAGGFPVAIPHSPLLRRRILALEAFVERVLAPLFARCASPPVEIMNLRGSGWEAIAETTRAFNWACSDTGRRIRSHLIKLTLDQSAMEADSPYSALASYIHERCHAFGGETCMGFSAALTDAISLLAADPGALMTLSEAWRVAAHHDDEQLVFEGASGFAVGPGSEDPIR
ncbi:MAG: hypothetical protein RBU37_18495 [Myxococcota bacterium]|jgi:hypothetical protein|nr:hypothetical protein [Myxococcota bacterium]